jgi:hypothetical protein
MDPYYTPPVDSSTIASLPQPDYLNVEYIFYKIYVFFHGIGSWFSSSTSSTGVSDMSSMGASRAEWFGRNKFGGSSIGTNKYGSVVY